MNTPDPPHWTINYHFAAFRTIWVHFETIRLPYKTQGKTFLNKCKSSWHEDVSEFFATNAPDPPHWTLNTCFGAFLSICVHLGPLGCLTKLGAKHSELVQKFVQRGRVGVFNDERTRSTPLDPNLMFWCVSYHLGAFGIVWLPLRNSLQNGPN